MSQEKDYDFVIKSQNFLSEEEMAEAFQDFDFFQEMKTSLKEHLELQDKGEGINLPRYDGEGVTKAREVLNLSPLRFASVLGVTPETVAQWERGDSAPNSTACNLLYLLSSEPSLVNKFI